MRFTSTLLLPFALAAPYPGEGSAPTSAPSGITIGGVTYAGSGCKANTVAGALSQDKTTLTLTYDSFVAQAGKNLLPADTRKNCQLNVALRYPQGWQYSVFKADFRGFAALAEGDTGTCKATYYFSGASQQYSSSLVIKGPFADNYWKTDAFGVQSTVWSPCGTEGMLNVNSEVRVTPIDTQKSALMTVDSTDLKFTQLHYLQWRQCTK